MANLVLPAPLVSIDWLLAHQQNLQLVLLDATFQLPNAANPVEADADARWIPGARRFDFDRTIRDRRSELPHMLPSEAQFTQAARRLGINKDSVIVVYDRIGTFSSPRAWWMFRAMGHDQVAVLDGGLPSWQAAGQPTEAGPGRAVAAGDFSGHLRWQWLSDADAVAAALDDDDCVVLDARSAGRFAGTEPEPRAGLRRGHMPGAGNLPFDQLQSAGRMAAPAQLQQALRQWVAPEQHLICSCGSGVTACILALAAELTGHERVSVYDGSWAEWGLPSGAVSRDCS